MQQLKVSMVMPCYNKAQSIGEMFDSIIAQEWDNIELILVNDGSTDGTREVITGYESKFLERGFKVHIIDQKNAGVCAAAKAGLERVTGNLVCMVDADDELVPKYVSIMAEWLMEHEEYDFTACEGQRYTGRGARKQFQPFEPKEIFDDDPYRTERWLLADFNTEPWRYMLRAEYFRKCRIVETYHTQTEGSHEPGYIIPILANGGKLRYFPLPLYCFNIDGESHSRMRWMWQMEKYYNEYLRLSRIAIEALPACMVDSRKSKSLIDTAIISLMFRIYQYFRAVAEYFPSSSSTISEFCTMLAQWNLHKPHAEFVAAVNEAFSISPGITPDRIKGSEYMFYEMVKNCLITPARRIVGCGASRTNNTELFCRLQGTPLEPTDVWNEHDDRASASKIDYSSIAARDIIILGDFDDLEIKKKIILDLEKKGCLIIPREDISKFACRYLAFPELLKIGRPGSHA